MKIGEIIAPHKSAEEKGIYRIINKLNGKCYYGSARSFYTRWKRHLSDLRRGIHHSDSLQRAWNKYGESAFEFQVVEVVREDPSLVVREQYYLDSCPCEYNIAKVAGSCLGVKVSEATKEKHRAWKASDETRAKMSASSAVRGKRPPNADKPVSDETKAKISQSLMGNKRGLGHKPTPEATAKRLAAMASLPPRSAESRENSSRTMKERYADPEFRARYGKKMTWEIVDAIRSDHEAGMTGLAIAEKYGTSSGHVSQIVNNKAWVR